MTAKAESEQNESIVTATRPSNAAKTKAQSLKSVTIRFAGDSGDGMQITGAQFTDASAIFGNDLATLPDYPAEIKAPAGTVAGVSSYQIHFSSQDIKTPGDELDALVVMNVAALKANIGDLSDGGILVIDEAGFTSRDLEKAEMQSNPLEDGSLAGYRVIKADITGLTVKAVAETGLKGKSAQRCKNFYTLGMMYWLYDRPLEPTLRWLDQKFGPRSKYSDRPEIVASNKAALKAGYHYADTVELFTTHYRVEKAKLPPGRYRKVSGNEAIVLGLVAAAKLSGLEIIYGSYPITPASDILHGLSRHKANGVKTFQAEDEIAAICSAIGASYAGALGVTASSGPGISLKLEAMNLAVITELPLVVIDVQRGGPSTGLPTKTEQSDLLMAFGGRSGDSPLPILAAQSPADCFDMALEAARIALKYMTPVILLSDGYIANGSEPWRIPSANALPKIPISRPIAGSDFQPYRRDPETLARPWAVPGMKGLEHRIGGLEKQDITGEVSYDPDNHQRMTDLRKEKIARIAREIPEATVQGPADAPLLVVSWGGTYGAVSSAVEALQANGAPIAHLHLRYLNPFPPNLRALLHGRKRIVVPELNTGQLNRVLGGEFGIPIQSITQVRGKPFKIHFLTERFEKALEEIQ